MNYTKTNTHQISFIIFIANTVVYNVFIKCETASFAWEKISDRSGDR